MAFVRCRRANSKVTGSYPRRRHPAPLPGTGTSKTSAPAAVHPRCHGPPEEVRPGSPPSAGPRADSNALSRAGARVPATPVRPWFLNARIVVARASRYSPAAMTGSSTWPSTSTRAGADCSARKGARVWFRRSRAQAGQSAWSSAPQTKHSLGRIRNRKSAQAASHHSQHRSHQRLATALWAPPGAASCASGSRPGASARAGPPRWREGRRRALVSMPPWWTACEPRARRPSAFVRAAAARSPCGGAGGRYPAKEASRRFFACTSQPLPTRAEMSLPV